MEQEYNETYIIINGKRIELNDNTVGYCRECKDVITTDEDYVKDRGKLYCTYCYKILHNVVEELDFEQ